MFYRRFLFIGNKESWRSEAIKNPMPIFYSLRSITELFDGEYFTLEGTDVVEVGKRLTDALKVKRKLLLLAFR